MTSLSKILVVDDDELTREMLQMALSGSYDMSTACNGREALDMLEAGTPCDLVLLDVDMPGLNGYETCAALRGSSVHAELPVIFLSGRVTIEERARGYSVGADDYVTKPFEVVELKAKIALAISRKEKAQALSGQLDEIMGTVLTTADMMGEVGVVLDFQRRMGHCHTLEEVSKAFFESMDRYGLDGCLRLKSRLGILSCSASAPCSALEESILDHLERQDGPTIQSLGSNLSFNFGSVVVLVRNLMALPAANEADLHEKIGRIRDNVALLGEGAVSRLKALDAEAEANDGPKRLVALTQEALIEVNALQHANRLRVAAIFKALCEEVESSFIHLGLTSYQEEMLSETIRKHMEAATQVFGQTTQIESHLDAMIHKLQNRSPAKV